MKTILMILTILNMSHAFGYSFGDSYGDTTTDSVDHSGVDIGGLDMGEAVSGDTDTASYGGLDMGEVVSDGSSGYGGSDTSSGDVGGGGGGEVDAEGVVSVSSTSDEETGLLRSESKSSLAFSVIAETVTGKAMLRSQFNGNLKKTVIDTSRFDIHPNSDLIIQRMLKNLRQSQMMDPIARLGLRGVRVVVLQGLAGSFYSSDDDAIFLADTDINAYGVVPLHHELLHAGLYKARRSGTISKTLYSKINHLNKSYFSHFNGYVGLSQGNYGIHHHGVQEAVVIGMTLVKIKRQSNTMPDSRYVKKAKQYLSDFLSNKFLTRTSEGLPIRFIHSKKMTSSQIKAGYLNYFTTKDTTISNLISLTRSKVEAALPGLCTPGEIHIIDALSCFNDYYIYSKSEALIYQVCGGNMKFGAEQVEGCGSIIGTKGR